MTPYLTFAPIFIAQDEGFCADERLDVSFIRLTQSAEAIPALDRGRVDVVAGMTSAAVFNAIARGAVLRLVADKGHIPSDCSCTALVARPTLVERGALDGVERLRGRRIALDQQSFFFAQWVDRVLETAGLSLDDVTTAHVPDAALGETLEAGTGTIDLAEASERWLTRILERGQAVMWMPAERLMAGAPFAFIFYGRRLLHERPDLGERFLVVYLRSVRQYRQGKTARNVDILTAHTGLPRDLLARVCWPGFRADARIDLQAVVDFQAWIVRRGLLAAVVPAAQFWDPRFVDRAHGVLAKRASDDRP